MLGRTRLETLPRRRRGVPTIWLCLVAGLSVLALACAGASWGGNGYDAAADMNSMYSTTLYSGAQAWWKAGYTGKGVDVAVIDTGVSPVAGLDAPGKLMYGPDLSLESQAPNLTNLDTSGHGTFIAGLIAGRDAGLERPVRRCAALGLPGHGARRAHPLAQGRHRRRRRRRQPGDRGDRLGGRAPARPRPQHPRAQPLLRDELGAERGGRPALVRRGAGLEARHRRRRGGRQQRLPGRRRRTGGRRPRLQPVRDRRRRVRLDGNARARGRHGRRLLGERALRPLQAARLRRAGLAPPGPPRAGLVHRPDRAAGRDQQTLLPGHRDERGGGDRLRRSRARPRQVPEAGSGRREGLLQAECRRPAGPEPALARDAARSTSARCWPTSRPGTANNTTSRRRVPARSRSHAARIT